MVLAGFNNVSSLAKMTTVCSLLFACSSLVNLSENTLQPSAVWSSSCVWMCGRKKKIPLSLCFLQTHSNGTLCFPCQCCSYKLLSRSCTFSPQTVWLCKEDCKSAFLSFFQTALTVTLQSLHTAWRPGVLYLALAVLSRSPVTFLSLFSWSAPLSGSFSESNLAEASVFILFE